MAAGVWALIWNVGGQVCATNITQLLCLYILLPLLTLGVAKECVLDGSGAPARGTQGYRAGNVAGPNGDDSGTFLGREGDQAGKGRY